VAPKGKAGSRKKKSGKEDSSEEEREKQVTAEKG
jgi:hypothetical protein